MKILLISGHGAGDSGALGNGYREADLTRELVNLIAPKLRNYATVDVYPQSRNAYADACAGTFSIGKYDYVFEVHFNCYNISAYGTECFVVPEEGGIGVEQAIMKNMGKFFTLRDNDNIFDGVKRARFAVIRRVHAMGMSGALLETCFIDNPNDMKKYQANKNAIAQGIVDGIVTGFKLTNSAPEKPIEPKPVDGITIGMGAKGLEVIASELNVRTEPEGSLVKSLPSGTYIKCDKRKWVNGTCWFHYTEGWVSGKYLEGWVKEAGKWWYLMAGYKYPKNEFKIISGKKHYFDGNGYMVTGWKKVNGKWYVFDANGYMKSNCIVKYKGQPYGLSDSGAMFTKVDANGVLSV